MNVLAYVHLRNIYRSTGAGRVARELIEHVALRRGVNMHILADRSDYGSVVGQRVGGPWLQFPYHLFSHDTSTQQAQWLFLQRPAATTYFPEVQVTHCTMESYVPKAGSRLIVTIHDAAYFDGAHQRNVANYWQQLKWRLLYSALGRYTDLFHTVSFFSAERLAHSFPAIRSRIRVIHNAVSPVFFESGDSVDERRLLASLSLTDRQYVLIPGGLHYRKNAELVLRAWPLLQERIKDLALVVAGHNSPDYPERLRAAGGSCIFTGFVDDCELRTLYRHSQAVWIPSQYEGFGMPILEAMACGAPVVASNNTAIPEVSGKAAILVETRCPSEHVEALATVVTDGQLRRNLHVMGKRRAAPFTWSASAEQLHALYAQVA